MKKIKIEVLLEVEDNIQPEDITVTESDIIDGFEISRNLKSTDDDVTENFYLKEAKLVKAESVE